MKLTPLLVAMFLAGTPASADDLLYLKCRGDLTSEVTNTETSEVIQKNKGRHSTTFIFDRERRRIMLKGGKSMNAEISDGVVTGSGKTGQGFSTTEASLRISIAPVSEYAYQQRITQRNISMDVDAMGTCEEVDASVFVTGEEQ